MGRFEGKIKVIVTLSAENEATARVVLKEYARGIEDVLDLHQIVAKAEVKKEIIELPF